MNRTTRAACLLGLASLLLLGQEALALTPVQFYGLETNVPLARILTLVVVPPSTEQLRGTNLTVQPNVTIKPQGTNGYPLVYLTSADYDVYLAGLTQNFRISVPDTNVICQWFLLIKGGLTTYNYTNPLPNVALSNIVLQVNTVITTNLITTNFYATYITNNTLITTNVSFINIETNNIFINTNVAVFNIVTNNLFVNTNIAIFNVVTNNTFVNTNVSIFNSTQYVNYNVTTNFFFEVAKGGKITITNVAFINFETNNIFINTNVSFINIITNNILIVTNVSFVNIETNNIFISTNVSVLNLVTNNVFINTNVSVLNITTNNIFINTNVAVFNIVTNNTFINTNVAVFNIVTNNIFVNTNVSFFNITTNNIFVNTNIFIANNSYISNIYTTNLTIVQPGGATNLNLVPNSLMESGPADEEKSLPNSAGLLVNSGTGAPDAITWTNILFLTEIDAFYAYLTNTFVFKTNAVLGGDSNGQVTNINIGSGLSFSGNTLSAIGTASTPYASNVVSGGVLASNTLSATVGANGWVLGQSNAAPVWTLNGGSISNLNGANLQAGTVANAALANSSITIQGSAVALGGSTLAAGSSPSFNEVNSTNFNYLMPTNTGGGSALVFGGVGTPAKIYYTNITANTTLAAFTITTTDEGAGIKIRASCSGGTDRTLTFPNGCVGAGSLGGAGKPPVVTITNGASAWFDVIVVPGQDTNVFWAPVF